MRFALPLLIATLAAPAAVAQTAPAPAASAAPTVGAKVFDPQGAEAGTIDAVSAQSVVINTGTNKVAVPPTAIGTSPKGPTVSMTKAQLDAAFTQAASQAQGQFQSQLVAGAKVFGTGGSELGTIKATDAQSVTITRNGKDVKLPLNGFGPGPQGVTLGLSAEQLDAAINASAPAATPAPAEAPKSN